jgi:hypothetical protein
MVRQLPHNKGMPPTAQENAPRLMPKPFGGKVRSLAMHLGVQRQFEERLVMSSGHG